jgi:3-oxoacyl-(acyl-carrier-protein) synthase
MRCPVGKIITLRGIRLALRKSGICANMANMHNAYVGIVSRSGLNVLHAERTDTMRHVRRSATAGNGIGFWAVIPEAEAQVVRFLLGEGEQDSALRYLDQSAREIGRLLPLNP